MLGKLPNLLLMRLFHANEASNCIPYQRIMGASKYIQMRESEIAKVKEEIGQ